MARTVWTRVKVGDEGRGKLNRRPCKALQALKTPLLIHTRVPWPLSTCAAHLDCVCMYILDCENNPSKDWGAKIGESEFRRLRKWQFWEDDELIKFIYVLYWWRTNDGIIWERQRARMLILLPGYRSRRLYWLEGGWGKTGI